MTSGSLPAGPPYAGDSLAQVLTSSAAAAGGPVLRNALGLPRARRVCLVLVDGLGSALLRRYGGHAPYLKAVMAERGRTLQAAFPTTTATSLSSLGTGVEPGRHGLVGYDVLDPVRNVVVNQLGGWDRATDPGTWQPHPTVFEQLAGTEVEPVTVSLPKFSDSALTDAALRGSRFVAARTLHARFQRARDELSSGPAKLVYLYLNELDKAGHRDGTGSPDWLHALEEIDGATRRLAAAVPPDTLVLLTGDHGMVDVPEAGRIDYAEQPELLDGIEHTAGEPRFVHLYFAPNASDRIRGRTVEAWRRAYGAQAWVLTREEAVAAGWFGTVEDRVRRRIGDVLIVAQEHLALFDGRRVRDSAFEMVGQHGSPTRAEREVPLLTVAPPQAPQSLRTPHTRRP